MTVSTSYTPTSVGTFTVLDTAIPHQIYGRELSDSTEMIELRVDTTQIPRPAETITLVMLKSLMFTMLKTLWSSTKPNVISLKPGEVRRVDDRLIVEKTGDGRIILYEVVD